MHSRYEHQADGRSSYPSSPALPPPETRGLVFTGTFADASAKQAARCVCEYLISIISTQAICKFNTMIMMAVNNHPVSTISSTLDFGSPSSNILRAVSSGTATRLNLPKDPFNLRFNLGFKV